MLPGYVFHVTPVNATDLAADALDQPSLEALLTEAGLEAGEETRFTTRSKRLTEVVTRVLRFGSPQGAAVYLGWVKAHGADLLGSQVQGRKLRHTRRGRIPARTERLLYEGTFQYFVAWSRSSYAVTLRIGGPAAGWRSGLPFAKELDALIGKQG